MVYPRPGACAASRMERTAFQPWCPLSRAGSVPIPWPGALCRMHCTTPKPCSPCSAKVSAADPCAAHCTAPMCGIVFCHRGTVPAACRHAARPRIDHGSHHTRSRGRWLHGKGRQRAGTRSIGEGVCAIALVCLALPIASTKPGLWRGCCDMRCRSRVLSQLAPTATKRLCCQRCQVLSHTAGIFPLHGRLHPPCAPQVTHTLTRVHTCAPSMQHASALLFCSLYSHAQSSHSLSPLRPLLPPTLTPTCTRPPLWHPQYPEQWVVSVQ